VTLVIEAGSHEIEVSNADKVFFPESGITKGDLAEYYGRIAGTMLPHVADRALSLHRFPDGIDGGGFFQKETPDYFPDWIPRKSLEKEGGTVEYPVCEDEATLVYLADQGCITPHVWLSRVDRPRNPDRLIFDLDPPEDSSEMPPLHDAVRAVREVLDSVDLPSFLMTTGSAGYHVLAPLDRSAGFDGARELSKRLARSVMDLAPEITTVAQRKNRREGKVFVDYLRNSYAQTSVAPYSVRALPGAPVATPMEWDELSGSEPRSWSIENIFRRLGQREDPWRDLPATQGAAVDEVIRLLDEQGGQDGSSDQ
jgi:bifunctional non-homologous end joining protein LigD